MKTNPVFHSTFLGAATLVAACLLTLHQTSFAKDHDDDRPSHGNKKSHHSDHDRQSYVSRPRSSFTLSLGTGYAGRGYYYGPSGSSYYYERPEVQYYATREAASREYYSSEDSGDAAMQRALAKRGYYQGAVDGQIGPQSRRAIARYQADQGMRPTGTISDSLIRSLGL